VGLPEAAGLHLTELESAAKCERDHGGPLDMHEYDSGKLIASLTVGRNLLKLAVCRLVAAAAHLETEAGSA
jgi:hypothetical protein